ncbi:TN [Mytilus edulis]|uniref:TN n=1 Tax=Mytilus edulis TaxID=6550 RepID=A0A8S3Q7J3_MYTED|nr:TN [Mytilus edulis]
MLRKELKWIIEETKGQRETSRIVDLIKKGVRDVCVSKNMKKYRDCSEISSERQESGIYTIYPEKSKGIKVYCEMTDGKGWTVIQRRIDGSTDFFRSKFKLTVGDYKGTAGDYLSYNNGKYFSTKDKDNDSSDANCATHFKLGPWWNGGCSNVSLNLDLKKSKMRWSSITYIQSVMKIRKIN